MRSKIPDEEIKRMGKIMDVTDSGDMKIKVYGQKVARDRFTKQFFWRCIENLET